MKKISMIAVSLAASLAVLASPGAFAQGKTRAEVRQELIEAQKNGLNYVTDTSYPDVNPIFAAKVAQLKAANSVQDHSASTSTTPKGSSVTRTHTAMNSTANSSCVGGANVCNIYFGS